MTERRFRRIQEVLARRQPDLTILAEDVYKPHNLSAMLRTADAVGIGTVHAVRPTGGVPTYNATSGSAEKWVALRVHDDLDAALRELRGHGMQLLAAHFSPRAVRYDTVDYTRPTCVVFGNEKDGVTRACAEAVDGHVLIPMVGMVSSLNVSVATAVVLFEAQRQRFRAGFYDTPRLDERARNALAVRWLHPHEARALDERGLPLPALNPDGSLPADALARLDGSGSERDNP
ncbi:MAG TPA: tRNA (guanosine(18)-2'-O)-methyltransferase TrmH [Trueperaceae bacterium]|nr:tRNA (guanosine(18)-2'-O)-methyltransferase TrmH [Trueperaceae bacterium]